MSLMNPELVKLLNARLADQAARNYDAEREIKIAISIDKTAAMFQQLGATDAEMKGLMKFKERLTKQLIKKHKITKEELGIKGEE